MNNENLTEIEPIGQIAQREIPVYLNDSSVSLKRTRNGFKWTSVAWHHGRCDL